MSDKPNPDQNFRAALHEQWDLLSEFRSLFFGPDGQGNFYGGGQMAAPGGVQYSNAIIRFFRTIWFNRIQRWTAEWMFKTNGYAISAIDNMTSMTLGEGFSYKYENEAQNKKLQAFFKKNKWSSRSREGFQKVLVDGECFFRIFKQADDLPLLRWICPDFVFGSAGDNPDSLGILTEKDDYETVTGYRVNNVVIPASKVQHRKLGWAEDFRGTSVLFAIGPILDQAAELLTSLCSTAEQLSRFTAVVEHKSDQDSIRDMNYNIPNQPGNYPDYNTPQWVGRNCTPSEFYPRNSIVRHGDDQKWNFPGQYIDGEKYVSVLRAALRLAAARVGLPENVLSQDNDSIAAYNGQMVANSHIVKGFEMWQQKQVEWDVELLEMCGFDTTDLLIVQPEVAIPNKNTPVEQGEFLIKNRMASKSTVAKLFEVDYEKELPQIKIEDAADPVANELEQAAVEDGDEGVVVDEAPEEKITEE